MRDGLEIRVGGMLVSLVLLDVGKLTRVEYKELLFENRDFTSDLPKLLFLAGIFVKNYFMWRLRMISLPTLL